MINNKIIYQVDAFTDVAFKGNPAGVMIVENQTKADWMQNIAMEMNLSETAFIIPQNDIFEIRYFTPTKEVPLCGHASLASAHILYELGYKKPNETIHFKAKGAELKITKELDWVVMNFPVYPLTKIDIPREFKDLVGFEPIEMYSSIYDWQVALAKTESEILKAVPNFDALVRNNLGHLMITAKSDSGNSDFVVRCFVPISGINEDPVTGSAHCALTPLWAEKLDKIEMESIQLSARTGKLKVKLMNNRVEIKGRAVTIFKAELKV